MFPILYRNGPFVIFTHDVFMTLGILVGLAIYYFELNRRGMLGAKIFWISVAALVGGGIGARLSVVWEHPAYYSTIDQVPLSYFIAHSGKSIIGAIVGGYIAIALSKKVLGYTRSTGDCYALAIPAGMVIGRIGCFLSELPLGTPTSLPWGITVSPEAANQFTVCPGCDGPMHPSMLYEIIFNLLAIFFIIKYRHHVRVQGDLVKIYLLTAAIFRFMVEFVRGNPEMAWGLTSAQVALIPLTLLLVLYFVRQWRRAVYRMPAPPARVLAADIAKYPDSLAQKEPISTTIYSSAAQEETVSLSRR